MAYDLEGNWKRGKAFDLHTTSSVYLGVDEFGHDRFENKRSEDTEREMSTVFLSGSRKLGRLNEAIRARLRNMVDRGLDIIIGDASGADKAMQEYLAGIEYQNVTVYCVGDKCRNNVGGWTNRFVQADSKLRGRDFYAEKDKAMAAAADFGFVLWDGKSLGSLNNLRELVARKKKVVIYYSPDREFSSIASEDQLQDFLTKREPEMLATMKRDSRSPQDSQLSPRQTIIPFER